MGARAGDDRHLPPLLDHVADRVLHLRRDGLTIVDLNAAQAAGLGAAAGALRGRPLGEVLPASELAQVTGVLERLGPDTPSARGLVGSHHRWIEVVATVVPDQDDDEVVLIGRDVTERQLIEARLRESERRFDLAMDAAPIGMALIGLDGRFLRVNPALCALLGRSEEELLTLTTLDVTHPDQAVLDRRIGRQLIAGIKGTEAVVTRYVLPDGGTVWGLATLATVRDADGGPLYLVGQVVDVTERVEHESSIEEEAGRARDTVARLRELDELKDALISTVSHELRTPLTVIQGVSDLLRTQRATLSESAVDELLERLRRQVVRLHHYLGDLLELHHIGLGAELDLQLAPTDLAALVAEVVAASPVAGAPITVELEPVVIVVDPQRIERVIASLLDNAYRHTPPGTPIRVRLLAEGGGAVLMVEDEGQGIPDELKDAVFTAFRQGPSHVRGVSGAGLGLAVVRRVVALHGGRCWIEDAPAGGTCVKVRLPRTPPEPAEPAEEG